MNINRFHCSACGDAVAPWLARKPHFQCAGCGQGFRSNYRRSLRRSALAGVLLWATGTALSGLLGVPWPLVFMLAIELGGLLAFGAAFLLHRTSIRVTPDDAISTTLAPG